jgi:FlaA1/EpsC-like NDP-sugar epimerase
LGDGAARAAGLGLATWARYAFEQTRNNWPRGFPVPVTDPDVTRFLMTIPEAVQLVIQAAAIGGPGEALMLDMGAPVRIVDLARQLMAS